jgi:hypothetical protein
MTIPSSNLPSGKVEWINVNKRKPRSGKLVLVYTPEKTILGSQVLLGTYWSDTKDWTVNDFERLKNLIVTHWMPIPIAPRH